MKKSRLLGVVCACLATLSYNVAQAVVLTFDDVPGGSTQNNHGAMPTYKDFNFNPTLQWIDLVDGSFPFGAHSGEFGILNNFGGTGIITEASNADFVFDGVWAKKWSTGPESGGADSLFGTLSGYNDGSLVWEVPTSLNGSYEFYGPQAGTIDELRLGFGGVFLVDDITLNEPSEPPETAHYSSDRGSIRVYGVKCDTRSERNLDASLFFEYNIGPNAGTWESVFFNGNQDDDSDWEDGSDNGIFTTFDNMEAKSMSHSWYDYMAFEYLLSDFGHNNCGNFGYESFRHGETEIDTFIATINKRRSTADVRMRGRAFWNEDTERSRLRRMLFDYRAKMNLEEEIL